MTRKKKKRETGFISSMQKKKKGGMEVGDRPSPLRTKERGKKERNWLYFKYKWVRLNLGRSKEILSKGKKRIRRAN